MINLVLPKEGFVILERDTQDKATRVGFVIPEAVDEAQPLVKGIIRTIGTEAGYIFKDAFGEIHKIYDGQKILFEKNRGTIRSIDNKEHIFIENRFVVALINEEEKDE